MSDIRKQLKLTADVRAKWSEIYTGTLCTDSCKLAGQLTDSLLDLDLSALQALIAEQDAEILELSESIALGPGSNIIKTQAAEIERLRNRVDELGSVVSHLLDWHDMNHENGIPDEMQDSYDMLIEFARAAIERL